MASLTLNENKDGSPNDRNEVKGQVHEISTPKLGQTNIKKSESKIPNKCLRCEFLERRLEDLSKLKVVRYG